MAIARDVRDSAVWNYACECARRDCARRMLLPVGVYRRLSARGHVRHVSCIDRMGVNVLDAHGDARVLVVAAGAR